jgi:hypothetical protein
MIQTRMRIQGKSLENVSTLTIYFLNRGLNLNFRLSVKNVNESIVFWTNWEFLSKNNRFLPKKNPLQSAGPNSTTISLFSFTFEVVISLDFLLWS